jgi:hypothetical protein
VPATGHKCLIKVQARRSALAERLAKISTESRTAQRTFFFQPRYCRDRKDDPT